jgi:hypothetical protein
MSTPRLLEEWSEEDGPVLWWRFPVDEPPYVGTPFDLGFTVEIHSVDGVAARGNIGGWRGYHTHWTRIPLPTVDLGALAERAVALAREIVEADTAVKATDAVGLAGDGRAFREAAWCRYSARAIVNGASVARLLLAILPETRGAA